MALTRPFAQNGDKLTIPDTASDSSVSYNLGFTYAYALPPEEGGKFIDRAQFNQLMYDTTSQVIANTTAIATKANANATVNLAGNQNIQGVKTFSAPPVSATNPTNNNQVANKAYVDSVGNTAVKLTGNQEIAGTKTFTSNIVSPNITQMQNNLNSIFSSTTSPVKTQTTTKVITVGTGGNFQTIPEAFAEAIKYTSPVEIRLISDLNTTGNIDISYINGANINLNFNTHSLINTNPTTSNRFGFFASKIGDIKDLRLKGYTLTCNFNTQVFLSRNIDIQNISYNSGAACIQCWRASLIDIYYDIPIALSSGGSLPSIEARAGGIVALENNTITDTSNAGSCLNVYLGALIFTGNSTINASTTIANQAANIITNNGIIFGNYSL